MSFYDISDISDIESLITDINNQISIVENIDEKKSGSYREWNDFLISIKEKISQDKYKFVFIGQKGVGKTTTILELFGLSKTINGKREDLLTTASGGTTTCEVELFKSEGPNTYFEIDPIDDKLFNQYIDDFCMMYESEEMDDELNALPEVYLPTEISRSLRNMIGLGKKAIRELHE